MLGTFPFSIDPLLFCSFNGTIKSFLHFSPKKKTNNLVRPVVPPIANYFTQNITYNYLELVQIIDIVTLDKIKEILVKLKLDLAKISCFCLC